MDSLDVISELTRFNNSITTKNLFEKFKTKSFFEIISKDRDELIHSRILKWIFELDNLPCEWKYYPIMNLLDVILMRAIDQGKYDEIDEQLCNYIILRNKKITVREVNIEVPTTGVSLKMNNNKKEESGRSDLIIECDIMQEKGSKKLIICIENKIDSSEHSMQTWKYYAYIAGPEAIKDVDIQDIEIKEGTYQDNYKDNLKLFVFLTPHSDLEMEEMKNEKKDVCSCPHFIHINYQDLMNQVLANLQNLKNLDIRTKTFVTEYMNTLSIPYIDNQKKFRIMAFKDKDSELLRDFWAENKSLILASLKAIAEDGSQDEEERNIADEAYKKLSSISNLFTFSKEGGVPEINLRMPDVAERVAVSLLEEKNDISKINGYFAKVKKPFLISEDTYKEKLEGKKDDKAKKRERSRWRQLNERPEYYVTTQWTFNITEKTPKPNFPIFMGIVNKKFKNKFNIKLCEKKENKLEMA